MERGSLWLPLLAMFIWLTWAGWNEFQKVEAYRVWARQFQRAKYDIYAVMGLKDGQLVVGKPTRRGPIELQTLLLNQFLTLQLVVDGQVIADQLPKTGRNISLHFLRPDQPILQVPFTDLTIAGEWRDYLQQTLKVLALTPPSSADLD